MDDCTLIFGIIIGVILVLVITSIVRKGKGGSSAPRATSTQKAAPAAKPKVDKSVKGDAPDIGKKSARKVAASEKAQRDAKAAKREAKHDTQKPAPARPTRDFDPGEKRVSKKKAEPEPRPAKKTKHDPERAASSGTKGRVVGPTKRPKSGKDDDVAQGGKIPR